MTSRSFQVPRLLLVPIVVLAASLSLSASGYVGVYAVVEKVVFEPNDKAPERVQIWGSFAYADGAPSENGAVSPARRGYLYFTLPPESRQAQTARQEWMDLKSVAGTGQAVGFGAWIYWGTFGDLDPAEAYRGARLNGNPRVRNASEPPSAPIAYPLNVGVVKIPADGSRRDVVERLRRELTTP